MNIEYKNTFSDIFLFHAVHQFLSLVLQGFLLLFCVFIFFSELNESNYLEAFFKAVIWYIFLWMIQIAFNAIYAYSKVTRNVFIKRRIEISDEYFYEQTEFNKSFFYWHGILKAISFLGFVVVYVTPSMVHIIPNRAFISKEERLVFLQLVTSKINAAKKAV